MVNLTIIGFRGLFNLEENVLGGGFNHTYGVTTFCARLVSGERR